MNYTNDTTVKVSDGTITSMNQNLFRMQRTKYIMDSHVITNVQSRRVCIYTSNIGHRTEMADHPPVTLHKKI